MNLLIADSGSTKTDWSLLQDGDVTKRVVSLGINPFMVPADEISRIVMQELIPHLSQPIDAIRFYGAGCRGKQRRVVKSVLQQVLNTEDVNVESDLQGAAIALCREEKGIACILGTGSNSCLFDGQTIVENVAPLGFILGDEGSGAVLGRRFLSDLLKNQLSTQVRSCFEAQYSLSVEDIVQRVYKQPFPNRFMAGFAIFLGKYKHLEEIQALVKSEFERFFRRNVAQYNHPDLAVHFVGSIAFYFRVELQTVAVDLGYRIGRILKSPIAGLEKFYAESKDTNLT